MGFSGRAPRDRPSRSIPTSRLWLVRVSETLRLLSFLYGIPAGWFQGCGISRFSNFCDTSWNPPLYEQNSLWEALSVVSQKGSFPTALAGSKGTPDESQPFWGSPPPYKTHPHGCQNSDMIFVYARCPREGTEFLRDPAGYQGIVGFWEFRRN